MTPEIYTPPNCFTLDQSPTEQQIRLGIQGYGGTGKTWAALTFPNPIVLNLDRGLGAHTGRKDVIEIPMHSEVFCKVIDPNFNSFKLKDVVTTWLSKEGCKLTANQTLIFDGGTPLQNAYHRWYEKNKNMFLTKEGKIDGFAEWSQKKVYYGEIYEVFKTLRCNVVVLNHEVDQRDKVAIGSPVSYSGKIRPLLSGGFADELVNHHTDFFRQLCRDKKSAVTADELKQWGFSTQKEYDAMCDTFSDNTIYYWQTEGDDKFDAKRSSLVGAPRFIPARYESFLKYRRKN